GRAGRGVLGFVLGERDVERAGDAALVARARRNAQAGDVAQIETQEAAERGVGLSADAHHALTVVEIESLRDRATDDDQRLPARGRARVLDAEDRLGDRL